MRISNYREISGPIGHLASLRPFVGNSMSARVEANRYSNGHPVYVVSSYRTVVATVDLTTGERWIGEERYSVTTSKHQGYIRGWLGTPVS